MKMAPQQFEQVLLYLDELKQDPDMTRKFKEKAEEVTVILNNEVDLALDKALLVLEEFSSSDLTSYNRTQVWDLISMLESAKN
tara:strand:+ start:150 stop:398 length:249 start_codon:yes stop_codon:yes gene_type:complete